MVKGATSTPLPDAKSSISSENGGIGWCFTHGGCKLEFLKGHANSCVEHVSSSLGLFQFASGTRFHVLCWEFPSSSQALAWFNTGRRRVRLNDPPWLPSECRGRPCGRARGDRSHPEARRVMVTWSRCCQGSSFCSIRGEQLFVVKSREV